MLELDLQRLGLASPEAESEQHTTLPHTSIHTIHTSVNRTILQTSRPNQDHKEEVEKCEGVQCEPIVPLSSHAIRQYCCHMKGEKRSGAKPMGIGSGYGGRRGSADDGDQAPQALMGVVAWREGA